MVRYSPEHKQATRQRILDTAGRRLKRDGIDGAGIAVLMADAGLTNGAFYAHFDSKDDLVATVVAEQLRAQRVTLAALPPGRSAIEGYVREYLSPAHRDLRGEGCPSAALLDEIGRCGEPVRQAYSDGVGAIADTIAAHLAPKNPPSARAKALGLLTLLVGTMQLARALPDENASTEALEIGIDNALRMIRWTANGRV
jgi:TetR/AcrR family transcriptional repressor of nem operon